MRRPSSPCASRDLFAQRLLSKRSRQLLISQAGTGWRDQAGTQHSWQGWMMDLYLGFVFLEGLLAVAIVGTNLLVCATVCLHRELRSVTNCLVACLALADLGVGALAIPFSMVLSMQLTVCFYTCLFLACFPLVTTQFSILLLLLIALNAHLKIRLPSSYAVHVRKGRMLAAVGLCWLLSLLIGLSPMMGWNRLRQYIEVNQTLAASFPAERAAVVLIARDQPYGGFLSKVYPGTREEPHYSQVHDGHLGHCSFTSAFTPEYLIYFVFLACTLLPLVALGGIYADLFWVVRGHLLSRTCQVAKRGELQMARSLLLLVGIFCVCWIPLHVIYCFRLLCPSCQSYAALDRLAVLLSHLNSLANPLVYAMRKKDFGLALRSVFLRYVLCWPRLRGCCCPSAKVHPQGWSSRR
ncbi:adenosine receptor A1-like [Emydura macquarii macquarii]|uniref:adenosine receptor A1-like n=1 Tax=Emydura macquarii macquarii TaxID=1129001 RepID=UPI00352B90B3